MSQFLFIANAYFSCCHCRVECVIVMFFNFDFVLLVSGYSDKIGEGDQGLIIRGDYHHHRFIHIVIHNWDR